MSVLILEKGSGQSKEIMMLEAMGLAPRFIELFKKGLGAGILSSNEIASALPLQTETNKSAWKKEFDWVLNCIQLFGIRIVFGNNKSRRSKSSKKNQKIMLK